VRIPTRRRQYGHSLNLTPMIDVVFNLVIFFLVTSHFARSENSEQVNLPKATQGQEEENLPHRLVITIPDENTMRVNGRDVTLDEIRLMLVAGREEKEFSVQIRADEAVPYGTVEPLLLECAAQNITRFGFKTTQ
jgi:biopolymer transport protein ExbD